LIKNLACGLIQFGDQDVQGRAFNTNWADRLHVADRYQRQYYHEQPLGPECGNLPVPRLDWSFEDAPCPFTDAELCISNGSTPVKMASGYINSNMDLGINSRAEDSIDYQRTATCSPIQASYTRVYHYENITNATFTSYHYGYNPVVQSEATFNYSSASYMLNLVKGYVLT
jgi:hypothetical protein